MHTHANTRMHMNTHTHARHARSPARQQQQWAMREPVVSKERVAKGESERDASAGEASAYHLADSHG